jgi:hypothetical protein
MMETSALVTMLTVWTIIISFLTYFLSKAMRKKLPSADDKDQDE